MTLNLTAITGTLADAPLAITPTQPIRFVYQGWEAGTAIWTIEAKGLWFGTVHPDARQQWFLRGTDLETGQVKDFAVRLMTDVTYAGP